ncbi:MAG: S-layer homology domain-containing protein [Chloroflexia bacterium]
MRRIISLSFALLLITVFFVMLVSGPAASAGTRLSVTSAGKTVGDKTSPPEPPPTGSPIPTATRTAVPFPTGTPVCSSTWYEVESPNVGIADNVLEGIDGVGTNDLWSVGFYLSTEADGAHNVYKRAHKLDAWQERLERGASGLGRPDDGTAIAIRTLIQHWNGSNWTVVPSPNIGTNDNHLLSVNVLTANDAWASGYYLNDFGIAQSLVLHWDGTSWTQVAAPSISPYQDSELLSVEAIASDDAWAVGYSIDENGIGHPLTQHWDGTAWSVVVSPDPPNAEYGSALRDLTIVSPTDIWAGGFLLVDRQGYGLERTMAMHWDGAQWSVVSTPNIGAYTNTFNGLDAAGPNDVWAVGSYRDSTYITHPMSQHWDGTQWSIVFVPSLDSSDHALAAIDVVSPTDIWAVGSFGGYSYAAQSFAAHWNGQVWEPMHGPDFSIYTYNLLVSVTAFPNSDVWAVGRALSDSYTRNARNYVAHYGDILTTCNREFVDVTQGSTFYNAIHYLSCRSVLSGYTCGGSGEPCNANNDPYFRPNGGITRGQLSKIVSNAAGFDEDPGYPIFGDMNYYDTYYVYVGRLYNRGIVSGYACGSTPAEPCYGPGFPLYFRPGASATRGQIAKIVAEAKGYTGPPTTQRFQDVPSTSTYYRWIENLATAGAMNGYPCGGPTEPCVGPENRPYFRPGANATRGQLAKIVTITFYPGCDTGR